MQPPQYNPSGPASQALPAAGDAAVAAPQALALPGAVQPQRVSGPGQAAGDAAGAAPGGRPQLAAAAAGLERLRQEVGSLADVGLLTFKAVFAAAAIATVASAVAAPAQAAPAAPAGAPAAQREPSPPARPHEQQQVLPQPAAQEQSTAPAAGAAARLPPAVLSAQVQGFERAAMEAFAAANTGCPASMLSALEALVLAGHGGAVLQGVVVRWGELSAAQQRAVFGAAMVVAGNAAWDWLELALHLALKRAAG
ncbi:hypothetical protein C2E20_8474 [Micractinium conductrix]|uniref:Uncharacterized protein n=1 Tax=Micractinium conductrix TaxID=554055 RepID=A0A2P6V1G8_9CHLO|nr:hypothetical protein C2E20_8474 [Micractinium conductrix]|eukprot:PSC67923.1 hypothetical protein C2E20_8474 [Micractinium conductrix]